MRGARISVYTLTVNPDGAMGIALAGLSTSMPRLGRGELTAGSRSACGCGGPDDRCAADVTHITSKPMTKSAGFRVASFMRSLLCGFYIPNAAVSAVRVGARSSVLTCLMIDSVFAEGHFAKSPLVLNLSATSS